MYYSAANGETLVVATIKAVQQAKAYHEEQARLALQAEQNGGPSAREHQSRPFLFNFFGAKVYISYHASQVAVAMAIENILAQGTIHDPACGVDIKDAVQWALNRARASTSEKHILKFNGQNVHFGREDTAEAILAKFREMQAKDPCPREEIKQVF